MAEARSRILVLAPAAQAAPLTALLDESGYLPVLAGSVAEAQNLLSEAPPAAVLTWVQPGDADSLAALHQLADRGRGLPVLAVVGGEGAAMEGMLAQLGARATILLVPDASRDSLQPLRQVLQAGTREAMRRRLGRAIP